MVGKTNSNTYVQYKYHSFDNNARVTPTDGKRVRPLYVSRSREGEEA